MRLSCQLIQTETISLCITVRSSQIDMTGKILEILGFDPDAPDAPITSFPIINNVPLAVDTSRAEIVFGLSWVKDYPSVSDGLWRYDYQNNSVRQATP